MDPKITKKQQYTANALLFLTALIWGVGFIPQKLVTDVLPAFCFNGIRYLLGGLVVFFFARCRLPFSGPNRIRTVIAGSILFTAAALQQYGIKITTVGNTSFITAIYVVLVPFLSSLFFKKRVKPICYLAAVIALIGIYLLSTGGKPLNTISKGDIFIFIGSIFWALHIIVVGDAATHGDPISFSSGQFLVSGVLNIICWLIFDHGVTDGIIQSWWILLISGVIIVGVGYTLQVVGQKNTKESQAAIILSLESVFGALSGFLFLGDSYTLLQIIGAVIIMCSVWMAVRSE